MQLYNRLQLLHSAKWASLGDEESGLAVGEAETNTPDPKDEDFPGTAPALNVVSSFGARGVMRALRLLGGNNGTVGDINNQGE